MSREAQYRRTFAPARQAASRPWCAYSLVALGALSAVLPAEESASPAFFPDDPLWAEPAPEPVGYVAATTAEKTKAVLKETFRSPAKSTGTQAANVNTLDEVPDSPWFTNRHRQGRMSVEAIAAGPGSENPPSQESPWQIVEAKVEGVTPGFTIEDEYGRLYVLKFDVPAYPEMASAAEAIGARFFHALGYYVPETHIVRFRRDQFALREGSNFELRDGGFRPMRPRDLQELLATVKPGPDGHFRAVASRVLPGRPVGPFRLEGTRPDDPNDIVPHEDRREIRALRLFAAWLGHTEIALFNSLDTVVESGGIPHIRHHLIDFGATLGSGTTEPKDPHEGFEYEFEGAQVLRNLVTLGIRPPAWARARYPEMKSVGRFEATLFDPKAWKPRFPVAAFDHATERDNFWAAKQVAGFSSDEIHAIVRQGKYSDPEAAQWLARCLILRRDKIVRAYLPALLALDDFAVRDDELRFADLNEVHGLDTQGPYHVQWYRFDNATRQQQVVERATGFALPAIDAPFLAARVSGRADTANTIVYVRRTGSTAEVCGLDRYPPRELADRSAD